MCTGQSGIKRIEEILRLLGHESFAKFHDAHGVRWSAVVDKYKFSDPEIAGAHHSPDRQALFVRLHQPALLNIAPPADPLARLRIIQHGVLVIDFMFNGQIAASETSQCCSSAAGIVRSSINLSLSAQLTRGMTPGMPVLIYPRSRNDLSQLFQTNVR
jgi:hypothetical protein